MPAAYVHFGCDRRRTLPMQIWRSCQQLAREQELHIERLADSGKLLADQFPKRAAMLSRRDAELLGQERLGGGLYPSG